MPGFVLLDKNEYLKEHYQTLLSEYENNKQMDEPQILDAWLDFASLKYQAESVDEKKSDNNNKEVVWNHLKMKFSGYLVPIMTGYKSISKLYEPGEVLNTRDANTSTVFVEAIHSIGEWKGVHRIQVIEDIIWHYEKNEQWYLCKQKNETELEQAQNLNFNDALNFF